MKLNNPISKTLSICIAIIIAFLPVAESKAQCTANISICTPGTAGPFTFVNANIQEGSCLSWFGTTAGYIILHITTSGPLNMLIDGNAATGYLDVAVFNIPSSVAPCTAIQNPANEIGCNFASAASGCNQFGTAFPCTSTVPAPNVTAGQEIMIIVENYSGTSSSFTLSLGPAPGAQTGPPNPTITPVGPYCTTSPSVQLVAADMGGTWSGPGVSASGMFNPATAGAGTHTINYSVGTAPCNATSSTTIVVNSPAVLSISPATASVCAGQSITLTASGSASYSWLPGGATTTSITVSPATTTTYTVTSPGCASSATRTVTVTPVPVITVNSPIICIGQSASLTAGGGTSYTWSPGATSTGTNTASASPTSNTSYTVTGTTSGCSSTAVSTVTVNSIPVISVNSPTICNGNSASLTASGASAYSWSTGAVTNPITVSPTTTTSYTVTGTTSNCSATAVATVTVTPPSPITVNSAAVCAGQPATLTAAGSTAYIWSTGSTANPLTVTPATTTSYTVTETTSGCSATAVATVTVGASTTILVNSATICSGESTILTATGGSTYVWNTGDVTNPLTVNPTTSTSYTVTGSIGSCSGTAVATVTVNPSPTTTVNSLTICAGIVAGLTANGAASYTWSTGATSTGSNTADASPLTTTTYTVTGNSSGCTSTAVATVTVNPMPVTTVNSPSICSASTASLTAGGATSYTWSAGAVSTGTNTADASPASTTTYTVTGTSLTCTSTAVATVTVSSGVLANAGSNTTICNGASTTLNVTPNGAGFTYAWSPTTSLTGANTFNPVASPATTTTYSVLVSDASGCTGTSSVTVTVLPLPVALFNASATSGCDPLCVTFTDNSTVAAGTATTWAWSFGDGSFSNLQNPPVHCYSNSASTSQSFTVGLTITYTASGCSSSLTNTNMITVHPNPVANFSAPLSSSISTPTVNFTNLSTNAATSHWNFGDLFAGADSVSNLANPSHTYTETGTYCVTLSVVSANGCVDATQICVVIDPEFSFFIPNAFSPNGDGLNDDFYGKGDNIKKFEMRIYDRWGNLTFFTDDIDKHWDGRANHGSDIAQSDVYVYMVALTDHKGKKHKYTGTVTIVK